MQPPAQQPSPTATTMYMPPQQAMMGGGLFSLHKFLMIGVILILIAGLVSVLPDFSGPPAVVDYENLTGSDLQTKMNEEEEKYNDFVRLMDTFATIIGMAGVGLIGYAFVREAYDEDTTTPALRITLLILGTIMLLQLVGSGFNLSVSL
ncbi:MAG: hypothetical protein CMB71_00310 [Euryarchaeota archaeon]|nr:hypothetical protein [Euryarchaeota archaeon]|tara:strand:- start:4592 stop:5038 length:447 start_codon:yes stop_codon:yes gene_type:complete